MNTQDATSINMDTIQIQPSNSKGDPTYFYSFMIQLLGATIFITYEAAN